MRHMLGFRTQHMNFKGTKFYPSPSSMKNVSGGSSQPIFQKRKMNVLKGWKAVIFKQLKKNTESSWIRGNSELLFPSLPRCPLLPWLTFRKNGPRTGKNERTQNHNAASPISGFSCNHNNWNNKKQPMIMKPLI